jgi:hypothetical protein
MRVTTRIITITAVMAAASITAAVASYFALPADQSASSLFQAIIAAGTLLVGASVSFLVFQLEANRQAAQTAERADRHAARKAEVEAAKRAATASHVQWALRRVAVEIIDVVEAADALVADPHQWNLTPLADDVWVTSRKLLAANMQCGELHYALTDFYKRLRVLQKADYLRLHLKPVVSKKNAAAIIEVQAALVIEAGHATLELLAAQGADVAARINERIALGADFAQPASAPVLIEQSEPHAA